MSPRESVEEALVGQGQCHLHQVLMPGLNALRNASFAGLACLTHLARKLTGLCCSFLLEPSETLFWNKIFGLFAPEGECGLKYMEAVYHIL
jgi:hypothetical protein